MDFLKIIMVSISDTIISFIIKKWIANHKGKISNIYLFIMDGF